MILALTWPLWLPFSLANFLIRGHFSLLKESYSKFLRKISDNFLPLSFLLPTSRNAVVFLSKLHNNDNQMTCLLFDQKRTG